jgi:hypothetical protein
VSQFATFLLEAVNLLHMFPDHQSFLSPSASRDVLAAAIAQLVSFPSNSVIFLFFSGFALFLLFSERRCSRNNNSASAQDTQMANIPVDAIYGSFLGVMFSFRTRFLVKQLVSLLKPTQAPNYNR